MQNLMDFLLYLIEMKYVLQSQLKILAKIQLSVICTHMVDFCRPGHICKISYCALRISGKDCMCIQHPPLDFPIVSCVYVGILMDVSMYLIMHHSTEKIVIFTTDLPLCQTIHIIDLTSCQIIHIIDLTSWSLSQSTKHIQLNPLGSLLIP